MGYLPERAKKKLLQYHAEIIDNDYWSEGMFVKDFERLFAEYYATDSNLKLQAITYNSAGTALFAAFRIFDVKKALVSNNTFYATGAMALEAGVKLTLVDCGVNSPNMSVSALADCYDGTQDTVIFTHVGGCIAPEYEEIAGFCNDNGLLLIEDAAHSVGVKHKGLYPGCLGTVAVFSFYPTKAVPIGEGGMVLLSSNLSSEIVDQFITFRNYGKFIQNGVVKYTGMGFNFRMDEWTAAVGCVQMERIKEILQCRFNTAKQLSFHIPPLVGSLEDGPYSCNWYKYIADSRCKAVVTTGKVYAETDQLSTALNIAGWFPNSMSWAKKHVCLPVGEKTYYDKSFIEVDTFLFKEEG